MTLLIKSANRRADTLTDRVTEGLDQAVRGSPSGG